MNTKNSEIQFFYNDISPFDFSFCFTLDTSQQALSFLGQSKDIFSTYVFVCHFDNHKTAAYTWQLIPGGYLFINAVYAPRAAGEGDHGVDCVIRVNRTIEFIFCQVWSKFTMSKNVTIVSVGNLASY